MKTTNVPTLRARHLELVAIAVTFVCAAAIVIGVVRAMFVAGDVPDGEPTVALIPPACASIDPEAFPCPKGVRW